MACISDSDVGLLLATLEKACSELKSLCNFETKEKISSFKQKIEYARYKTKKKKK